MKYLTFKQVRLEGEDCKKIPVGQVAIREDHIRSYMELWDKFDHKIAGVVMINDTAGRGIIVESSFGEITEKLETVEFE